MFTFLRKLRTESCRVANNAGKKHSVYSMASGARFFFNIKKKTSKIMLIFGKLYKFRII